jgi:small subunit ribosomal protein S18
MSGERGGGGGGGEKGAKIDYINYKDVRLLSPFIPERGKIQPRRISGTCAKHQRALQTAISRARQLALIPYVTD